MQKGQIPWNKGKKGLQTAWNKGIKNFLGRPHPNKDRPMSEEQKIKISNSQKGKILSEEHKKKISESISKSFTGEGNPFYGKTHSDITKKKISDKVRESILSNSKEIQRRSEMMRIYNLTQKDYTYPWNCGMHPWDWMNISEEGFYQKLTESQQRRPNGLETNFISVIKKYNLPFKYVGDGSLWICGKNPDFIDEDKKTIIELFGDYWHKDEDEITRAEHFKSYGFNTIIIWESEIKLLSEEQIVNFIMEKLK